MLIWASAVFACSLFQLFLLIKMGKLDEAYDFFKSLEDNLLLNGFKIQVLARNLSKEGKCSKAIECYNYILKKQIKPYTNNLEFHFKDIMLIDRIKKDFIDYGLDLNKIYFNDLYISWIDKLNFKKPAEEIDSDLVDRILDALGAPEPTPEQVEASWRTIKERFAEQRG